MIFLSPLKQGMDFFTGGSIIINYGLMEAMDDQMS